MDENYAFIGLGAMGYGMASNIRQKMPSSSVLFIYDVYAPACDKFVAEFNHFGRIEIAQSVKEAAEKTKNIISSLPNTAAVRAVYLDEAAGCIAAPDDPARLILECSTIGATEAREIAERLAAAKAGHYVDSPASGGTPAAVGGRLSFMIGHTEPQLSDPIGIQMQNTLKMMGDAQKLFWCGKTGDGLAAKISNNYIACSVFLIVEEALAIGARAGIDPNKLRQVIHNSSGQTFMGDIISSAPRSQLMGRNGFPTEIMVKDLSLAVNAGSELGITPKMALAALAIWKEAAKDPNVLNIGGFFQTNQ